MSMDILDEAVYAVLSADAPMRKLLGSTIDEIMALRQENATECSTNRRLRDEATELQRMAEEQIERKTAEITARCEREIKDAALTKELATAQVQALVVKVAELTGQLQARETELKLQKEMNAAGFAYKLRADQVRVE